MDVYAGRSLYITIANFGNVDEHLSSHQNVGEFAFAPLEVVHIKNERFSYPSGIHAKTKDSTVNAVYYDPTPDPLEQSAGHMIAKEKYETKDKRNWLGNVQLPAETITDQLALSEML